MVVEVGTGEATTGWPLGLGNINMRLRAAQNFQATAEPEPEPYNTGMPSPSFPSFSSSNLDTESTASFFQDQSVPLGRLIGIKPARNRENSHFQNQITTISTGTSSPNRRRRGRGRPSEITINHGSEQSQQQQGLCVPLLHNVIEKMSRNKSTTRH